MWLSVEGSATQMMLNMLANSRQKQYSSVLSDWYTVRIAYRSCIKRPSLNNIPTCGMML